MPLDAARLGALADDPERPPPGFAYRDRPGALPVTLERMKAQPRKRHISWGSGGTQAAQDQTQPFGVSCLNAGPGAGLEELGQALVFEPPDHQDYCNPGRYRSKTPQRQGYAAARSAL